MSDHFREIYRSKASQYDRLVSREDYQGNILPALAAIRALRELDVVEFGAGTGRLTRLLVSEVRRVGAFDMSAHMLHTARCTLELLGANWVLLVGDNREMPVGDATADLTIAGWSFGHAPGWYGDYWQEEIAKMVGEMLRILKPGGTAIIIETMGTGNELPVPPQAYLAAYYQLLEDTFGFAYTWIRTDYQFESVEEADELTRFFFGDELADRIVNNQMTVLPECTGIWWKHV